MDGFGSTRDAFAGWQELFPKAVDVHDISSGESLSVDVHDAVDHVLNHLMPVEFLPAGFGFPGEFGRIKGDIQISIG